ncbi:MAG: hypothetical protein ACLP8A_13710 [Methylovirgula sp.]
MLKRFRIFIALVFAAGLFASATLPATAAPFTSTDDNFAADFPGTPAVTKTKGKTPDGIGYDMDTWATQDATSYWAIAVLAYDGPVKYDYDKGIKGSVDAVKGVIRSQRTVQQSGVQGREVVIGLPQSNIVLRQRFLWIGSHLYQIVLTTVGSATSPEADKFFESFHTLK